MKQAQPSTTTPEAALRPLPGRKTATGVFDTRSEPNLWQTRTFSAELRWGVRYSQTDPLGLWGGMNLFSYSGTNPLRFIDPLGLFDIDASCDNCDWDGIETIEKAVDLAKKMAPCVFRKDIRNWFEANPDGDGITILCDDAFFGCWDGESQGSSPSAGGGDRFWLCTPGLRNDSVQEIANTILHEWMHKIPWGSDGVTDHNQEAGGIADQAERWYMRGLCEG